MTSDDADLLSSLHPRGSTEMFRGGMRKRKRISLYKEDSGDVILSHYKDREASDISHSSWMTHTPSDDPSLNFNYRDESLSVCDGCGSLPVHAMSSKCRISFEQECY
ncbi:unnamed protein product [Pleuronectes platessa]|uniref:Uncharacterized protein n=1 Tax=Pleuronectes platessa TaxID=8262 RepID=A0A9N7UU52_PLEPL|nr:unnamed protein product [Pleuronectes platessa]